MIERATSAANIQSMLRTMSSLQSQASSSLKNIGGDAFNPSADEASGVSPAGFGDAIKNVLNQVNESQMKASRLRESYEMGEAIPLTEVVIGMQKASLSFEATLQVRNKVLKAYEDILNMPV